MLIACQAEIFYATGDIHPVSLGVANDIEEAALAMAQCFGVSTLKVGTLLTARENTEKGKLLLTGVVTGKRPLAASVFGHDWLYFKGVKYDGRNIHHCPVKLGIPARETGDRQWASYISPRRNDDPQGLLTEFIAKPFMSSSHDTEDNLFKVLPIFAYVARSIVAEIKDAGYYDGDRTVGDRKRSIDMMVESILSVCDMLETKDRKHIPSDSYERMRRVRVLCNNCSWTLAPNYNLKQRAVALGNMLHSAWYWAANYHTSSFEKESSLICDEHYSTEVAALIRKSVGLHSLVYNAVVAKNRD